MNVISRYYRTRSALWRMQRLLFPSPAELRFIELLGGRVYRVHWLKHPRTGFCFAYVRTLGRWLESEGFKREVRYGLYWVDLANDLDRIIEIDGRRWHSTDVVADYEREVWIEQYCQRVRRNKAIFLRIRAVDLIYDRNGVQRDTLKFLTR